MIIASDNFSKSDEIVVLAQMGARIRHKCTEVKTLKNWRPSLTGKNLTVVIVQEESDIQTGGGRKGRFYKCKCQVDIGEGILC